MGHGRDIVGQDMEAGHQSHSDDTQIPKNISLVRRQWYLVFPLVIAIYVLLVFVIEESGICRSSRHAPFADWVYGILVLSATLFAASILGSIYNFIWESGPFYPIIMTDMRSTIVVGCAVPMIALASTAKSLVDYKSSHSICMDGLGVETFVMQWPEWMVSVPTLLYIAIALERKPSLSRRDVVLVSSMAVMIALGVVLIALPSRSTAVAVFVISCVMLMANVAMVVYTRRLVNEAKMSYHDARKSSSDVKYSEELHQSLILATIINKLSLFLLCMFPLFPLAHVLAATRMIDRDMLVCVNAILGVFSKTVFVRWLVCTPMVDLTDGLVAELYKERQSNASKRSYLNFVFHEVRVPMNTMTLGISVVEGDPDTHLSPASKEAMNMMTGATTFMSDTLNEVLNINKIEEGAMELSFAFFRVVDLVKKAGLVLKGQLDGKHIALAIDSADGTLEAPLFVLGDMFRLQHVLANFLSNAIKFSPDHSTITIRVSTASELPAVIVTPRLAVDEVSGPSTTLEHAKRGARESFKKIVSVGSSLAQLGSTASLVPKRTGNFVLSGAASVSPTPAPIPVFPPAAGSTTGTVRRWITIVVCDEGVGIPEHHKCKLFQTFSQIDAQALQQGQGSGLGLVFAQQIIELHGGEVVFDSTMGKGSTFGFKIPFDVKTVDGILGEKRLAGSEGNHLVLSPAMARRASHEEAVNHEVHPQAHVSATTGTLVCATSSNVNRSVMGSALSLTNRDLTPAIYGSSVDPTTATPHRVSQVLTVEGGRDTDVVKPRALLIDDTPSNTKMLKMLLQREGLVCDEAANGAVAVEMVRKGTRSRLPGASHANYNIVFMDCNMPVMDGLTATRILRTTLHFEGIVVGCSGNANDQEVDDFVEAGADFVMPKPMRFDELQRLLDYAESAEFTSIPNTQLRLTDSPRASTKAVSRRQGAGGGVADLQRLKAVPRKRTRGESV